MKTLGKVLLLVVIALFVSVIMVSCAAYGGYKNAVRLDEAVNAAWGKVESKLQALGARVERIDERCPW